MSTEENLIAAEEGPSLDSCALGNCAYDELHDPSSGGMRAHWSTYASEVAALPSGEFARRWEQAARQMRETGIAYNSTGDAKGMDMPWKLDPVPYILAPAEWAALDRGLVQRATLLNLTLEDLYGPQRLLRDGIIPPDFVFGHPGYLRPCHGFKPPQGKYLPLYAADVGRGANGAWTILADRTQAPAGAGYALLNRLTVTRAYQEVFQACHAHRLVTFFQEFRESLRMLAPRNRDNPRIVLLTPGPRNETYFEQAFLGRYLGYALVEGSDLTVRDNAVFVKTLGGLQPVDVILRRTDDEFCDPLDLRPDSAIGVAGLAQAARAGSVAIANPLGSGIAASPALISFLPGIARYFLGEELLLPSVPTWWCGQPQSLEYVLANLERLVIKPAYPKVGEKIAFGAALDAAARAELADRIDANPSQFIAQEQIDLSAVPSWTGAQFEPHRTVLRTYLASSEDSYITMPGGLSRIAPDASSHVVALHRGGISKDVWVLSDGPVSAHSLLQHMAAPLALSRHPIDQPSRVADSLFWLGRYVERTESLVRLLRAIVTRLTDETSEGGVPELAPLLEVLVAQDLVAADALPEERTHPSDELEGLLISLIHDPTGHSVRASVETLQRTSYFVRDRFSLDAGRLLNRLDDDLARSATNVVNPLLEALGVMDSLILTICAFNGIIAENMTRSYGWRFLEVGRRTERAIQIAKVLRDVLQASPAMEPPLLQAILEFADSSMTYRARYLANLQLAPVLDLILTDDSNPRSVGFQLTALAESLNFLPHEAGSAIRPAYERTAMTLNTSLRVAHLPTLCMPDEEGKRSGLIALLDQIITSLPDFSDQVSGVFFSHTDTPETAPSLSAENSL